MDTSPNTNCRETPASVDKTFAGGRNEYVVDVETTHLPAFGAAVIYIDVLRKLGG